MQLQDIANNVLWNLQRSELVNFGNPPNYGLTVSTPDVPQTALIFLINRAYIKVISDLADAGLTLADATFNSVASTSDYPLPPTSPLIGEWGVGAWGTMVWGSAIPPQVKRITRLTYQPVGQVWTQEFEGNVRLVSWAEFNRRTGFGFLRPFTYDILPRYAAVQPNRSLISFYPGSASTGDTIMLEYVPELTFGTSWAPLANWTDMPNLVDSAQDLIVKWAEHLCWPKLREAGAYQRTGEEYKAMLADVIEQLGPRSTGDTQRVRSSDEGLLLSLPLAEIYLP